MFAVIKSGGKQYIVQQGDVLDVEKLDVEQGQKVVFDQVLLIDDDGKSQIGTPLLENVRVSAEVLENFKDKKVIVFKKKRRKQYKKKIGHRQQLTRVKIEQIMTDVREAAKKEAAEEVKKVEEKVRPKKKEAVSKPKPKAAREEKPEKPAAKPPAKKAAKVPREAKASPPKKTEKKPAAQKKAVKTAARTPSPAKKKTS